MKSILKTACVAAVLGVMLIGVPTSAKAQDPYWRNHWGWYDNTYRPYYHHYYGPNYYGTYRPGYGGYYSSGPYYNGYYAAPGPTYVAPGVGVRVGRLNFGWW